MPILHKLRIRLLSLIAGDRMVIINARCHEPAVLFLDGWDQPEDSGMRYYINSCISPEAQPPDAVYTIQPGTLQ